MYKIQHETPEFVLKSSSVWTWPMNGVVWENSRYLWENAKKTRVLWPQYCQNKELFLECAFRLLPGVSDRKRFLQVIIIACWYHSIKCLNYPFDTPMENVFVFGFLFFFLPCVACPCNCTLYSCDSSYPSEYTLSETLRQAIAGEFSLPHSSVPPSQVPPFLEWRHYSNCSRRPLGLWFWSNFVWCSIFLLLFATFCYW